MAVLAFCPLRFKDGWLADWADYNSALHKSDRCAPPRHSVAASAASFILFFRHVQLKRRLARRVAGVEDPAWHDLES